MILTPHDGEFRRLHGQDPGADRLAAARDLAGQLGCVVLLKGGPTVVADPDGNVLVAEPVTPGWPPPAPVTCWPGSSVACPLGASIRFGPRQRERSCTVGPAT